ncbi:hypothetical protein LMG27198_48580 [Methylocystis echinoides]|uniref:Uncharacterized protein n=1 Tax=Methylocystis echinoides TaxID=29468 RepID=A0A9W6GZN0_9HYPH|nr:hypothetical protein LMG27198_48580 [Methylocystis echinoides]
MTADISKKGLRLRALQALQREGYAGRGEITVLSDGAEIMKRLPRGLPRPSRHFVDWFHIAMKIQPLQQVADQIVHCRDDEWTKKRSSWTRRFAPLNGSFGTDRSIERSSNRTDCSPSWLCYANKAT